MSWIRRALAFGQTELPPEPEKTEVLQAGDRIRFSTRLLRDFAFGPKAPASTVVEIDSITTAMEGGEKELRLRSLGETPVSPPTTRRVAVWLGQHGYNSRVLIDDLDVSGLVRGLRIEASSNEMSRVTLELAPAEVAVVADIQEQALDAPGLETA